MADDGFNLMEEVIQGRRHDGRDAHERFHFEDPPVAFAGEIDVVVEELTKAALHGQGLHGLADFLGLDHFVEDGQRPLLLRQDLEALQGVPDEDVFLRRHLDVALDEVGHDPFLGPLDFPFVVDVGKRLEGEVGVPFGSEVVEMAAHAVRQGTGTGSLIEDEDVGIGILQKVRFQRVEENGFTGPGRPDDERMPYTPYVEGETEGRIARRVRIEQYRPL